MRGVSSHGGRGCRGEGFGSATNEFFSNSGAVIEEGVDDEQPGECDGEKDEKAGPVVVGFGGEVLEAEVGQEHDGENAAEISDEGEGQGAGEEEEFFPEFLLGVVCVDGGNHGEGHHRADAAAALCDIEVPSVGTYRADGVSVVDEIHSHQGAAGVAELGDDDLEQCGSLLDAGDGDGEVPEERRENEVAGDFRAEEEHQAAKDEERNAEESEAGLNGTNREDVEADADCETGDAPKGRFDFLVAGLFP